jgi:hypothetical protein
MNGIMSEETTSDRLRAISLIDPRSIKRRDIPSQDPGIVPLKGLYQGVKGMPTASPVKEFRPAVEARQFTIDEPKFEIKQTSGRMMINRGQFQPRSGSRSAIFSGSYEPNPYNEVPMI